MKIVKIDPFILYDEHIDILKFFGTVEIYNDKVDKNTNLKRILDADIVISKWINFNKDDLLNLKNIKLIALAATGYHDRIDIATLKALNIHLCISNDYSTDATAEHTMGLILNACRLTSEANKDIIKGTVDNLKYKGIELKGKNLGIIGYGRIGKRLSQIAQFGFNMNINYTNSSSSREDLENLLKNSDIISINAPLTSSTKNLISYTEFSLMKKTAVLVNTGRGGIIDEEALFYTLKKNGIFAAGLDTLSIEPITTSKSKLLSLNNIIITPHIGWNTYTASYELSKVTTDNIVNFLKLTPKNLVF